MALGKLRNKACPCGSKKKYKKCCWEKDYNEKMYVYWNGNRRVLKESEYLQA